MGSFNEVAFDVLDNADRLIVDDPEYAAEIGDGGAWIAQGRLTKDEFIQRIDALAADVAAGLQVGRTSETDIVVALVQGMSTGDVAFANLALRLAEERSVGRCITLSQPPPMSTF
jgi:ornithine cyclodeaminase/alanine dehydrogenase-like protein (mu-crystallin family)